MNKQLFVSVLAAMLCASSQAHIVLDNQTAPAGSYYRGALRVGHGCSGSPVTQIIVTIPPGFQGAKPMPKAGWRIDVQRSLLAQSYVSHGRTVTEDVTEIRWTAKTPDDYLQDDQYDEFVIFGKLPEAPGKLYWKTSQICEQGRIDWHEVATGTDAKPKSPAAVLEIKAIEGAHAHHAH